MPGPPPKHASARARRNKVATAATLAADPTVRAPKLPSGGPAWHAMTKAWWKDIWASPMAPEFDDSDRHGLFMLAQLVNDFWCAESSSERMRLAAEVRQQGQRFGLSPIDRRRLQWEIERTNDAQEKGRRRNAQQAPEPEEDDDPRVALRAV